MRKLLVSILVSMYFTGMVHATVTATPHQLAGSIQVNNLSSPYELGTMTVNYNQRHPSLAACNQARTMAIESAVQVYPVELTKAYGKMTKVVHLTCLPIDSQQ